MIVTKIQGGLGNQLFQWAVTKNLSLKYNCPTYYDLSYFNGLRREFELGKLNLDIQEYKGGLSHLKLVNDDFQYQIIKDNTYLNGYWQSEKYFIENVGAIRDLIRMNNITRDYILKKYPFITSANVSIHIRRGIIYNIRIIILYSLSSIIKLRMI